MPYSGQPLLFSNTSIAELWGYTPILQIIDFTHHLIQLSNISGCNLSNGVALPPLGTVDMTLPSVAPFRSSWKGVCVTSPVSSLLQPEHFINTGTFCRTQAKARHELGMTPPSKVPGEFIWRPAQILCSSSSSSSASLSHALPYLKKK